MNTSTYVFQTPDHGYDFVPDLLAPDNVLVKSEFRDSLEELLETLQLAGVAEGKNFEDITIEEDFTDYGTQYYIEIDKGTLALYLQFEILNYFGGPSL